VYHPVAALAVLYWATIKIKIARVATEGHPYKL